MIWRKTRRVPEHAIHAAIHAAPHGLAILTVAGGMPRFLFVNRTFEAISGYAAASLLDQEPALLLAPGEEDFEHLAAAMQALRTGAAVLHCRRADGALFWAAMDVAPVEDGRAGYFVLVLRDVSEQKAAQARMIALEKMDAIGQLAAGITHDVNNILGATRAFAALIADTSAADSDAHAYANRIVAACDRAADMVRQLVTLTRAKDAPREVLPVHDIVAEAASLLPGRLPRTVKFSVSDATRNVAVVANASQVMQVLLNLAVNGADAMGRRGGELALTAFEVTIPDEDNLPFGKGVNSGVRGLLFATGVLKPRVPYVRFSVADDGPGISQEIAARIFEPFFTTKDKRRGTGLGLSIVNSIVTAHDGVIAVQSRPGAGTAFQVYLPAHRAAAMRRPEPPSALPVAQLTGTERILIVDDEVDIADALSISLARLGYHVTPAYCAREALEMVTRDHRAFDVIITDQSMPRLSGLELVRKVKFIMPGVKAILCTGHSDAVTPEGTRGDGIDAFFHKPCPAAVLASAIRRLCDAPGRRKLSA